MITNILLVIGLILAASAFANIVDIVRKKNKMSTANKMSFRETMDLTGLPLVTFKNGDKKVNFLLDTGANNSIINKSTLSELTFTPTGRVDSAYGVDGNRVMEEFVKMEITYRDNSFVEEFHMFDLEESFNNLKSDYGVNLHGIIGNSFLQKYKYIIDFDELVAYSVK